MSKLGHTKRLERAEKLAKQLINNRHYTIDDACRVACLQYDVSPNLIIDRLR